MKKSVSIMFHLLFWIISFLMILFVLDFYLQIGGLFFAPAPGLIKYIWRLLIILPICASIFYASYFSLDYFKKNIFRFVWLGIFYVGLIPVITVITIQVLSPGTLSLAIFLLLFLPIIYFNSFGFLFRTFIEWFKDIKIKAALEKEKIESQLELIKSRINPHFLFNTINNIDILILEDPRKASDYLKKLSDMLRVMLYDSNTKTIPLNNEIEHIKKFIELQKIRTTNNEFVDFTIKGDPGNYQIAPMIFVHFVENAFKYVANKKIQNAVSIGFDISKNHVNFSCRNHYIKQESALNGNGGMGFKLIKQRLDLLYKNEYTLNTLEKDNWYSVNLKINLSHDQLHYR